MIVFALLTSELYARADIMYVLSRTLLPSTSSAYNPIEERNYEVMTREGAAITVAVVVDVHVHGVRSQRVSRDKTVDE